MAFQKRIDAYGVHVGSMPRGKLNKITDVPGVRVGHCTVDTARHRTGVTVILPTPGNIFARKLVAASNVLNGFGKTLGLMQVDELGVLETPIALTNTLGVGRVHDALVQYTLDRCHAEGLFPTSINPVVCECHDGGLNDIAERVIGYDEVMAAIESASEDFDEGDVGGGKGMICHGFKGGIGSASRLIELESETFTLGVLVMSNHGRMADFMIDGARVGAEIAKRREAREAAEKGSIIMIVGTDLPVSDRQLRRVLRRAGVGLARLGGYIGHGSGEVMVGFTTANGYAHEGSAAILTQRILREPKLDLAFRAVAECCEEAVLNSMICADAVTGYDGARFAPALRAEWGMLNT